MSRRNWLRRYLRSATPNRAAQLGLEERIEVDIVMQQLRIAFSIIVGIAILAVWLLLYLTNSIPELATEPIRIWLHMAAELATGAALLAAGIGLWRHTTWAPRLHWLAMGALLYTLIQSPGYYAQMGEYAMVIVFAILLVVTLFLVTQKAAPDH